MINNRVNIIGGGFAGCEAALWLANKGVKVKLYEQKPHSYSPAHKNENLAELVCSNSFKAQRADSAAGILKDEMRVMGSNILIAADKTKVPAGGALSVDRDMFSEEVSRMVSENANIELIRKEVTEIPDGITIVASGPLTQGALAENIERIAGEQYLSFYDAAAPIVTAESLDMNEIFAASRYGHGDADYLNCPFDKAGYEAFHEELINAKSAPLHNIDANNSLRNECSVQNTSVKQGSKLKVYEACDSLRNECSVQNTSIKQSAKLKVYEACIPVEVLAKRGVDTLRFGPLRPVGLVNPKTGHRPWANIQLRKENKEGSLYNLVGFQTNLRFGEQKRVFSMIPGLKNAEFARYGVMHRNTFLNSPHVLNANLSLKNNENIFFAGQITGFEGYMESAASGLIAAKAVFCRLNNIEFKQLPLNTMCGALMNYIQAENEDFQPLGANLGILPPLEENIRDKRVRAGKMSERALQSVKNWNKIFD